MTRTLLFYRQRRSGVAIGCLAYGIHAGNSTQPLVCISSTIASAQSDREERDRTSTPVRA